jgi:hypothetical protein
MPKYHRKMTGTPEEGIEKEAAHLLALTIGKAGIQII